MPFSRRLLLFGVGVFFGLVLCYVFFYNNRDYPSWLPNDRMQDEFERDTLIVNDLLTCYMACWGVDSAQFKAAMVEVDVDFGESKVRDVEVKIYYSTIIINEKEVVLDIISRETDFELSAVISGGERCHCN
ncbi:MAG: hypothetical protein HRT71_12805 [Flavobacteriales bacterium]|nr:hypothetical protein [Flavobacteriales bacterium]